MDRNELKGRVAVVLGADGVGAAVCRLLAARGARIAVVGEDPERLRDVVDELHWCGADAVGVLASAGDAEVLTAVGTPDLLFILGTEEAVSNEEAVGNEKAVGNERDWPSTVDSGLLRPFQALRTYVPRMAQAKSGAVVTLAPFGADAATCMVGGGVTALTQYIAREVKPAGVRANVVSWTPGVSPVEDVAFAAVYLACDAAPGMTATTLDVTCGVAHP